MGPRRRGGPHLTSDVIYELEGGRKGRGGVGGTVAGVGESTDRFLPLRSARLHCTRGPREGSIKIISDALMRNYEGLSSFFIFAGTHRIPQDIILLRTYDILNCER